MVSCSFFRIFISNHDKFVFFLIISSPIFCIILFTHGSARLYMFKTHWISNVARGTQHGINHMQQCIFILIDYYIKGLLISCTYLPLQTSPHELQFQRARMIKKFLFLKFRCNNEIGMWYQFAFDSKGSISFLIAGFLARFFGF